MVSLLAKQLSHFSFKVSEHRVNIVPHVSSISISGGDSVRDLRGEFFVASMPSLLPMAISLVAWSSTSDRPLVKMLFHLRQGFGGQARCGSVFAQGFTPIRS